MDLTEIFFKGSDTGSSGNRTGISTGTGKKNNEKYWNRYRYRQIKKYGTGTGTGTGKEKLSGAGTGTGTGIKRKGRTGTGKKVTGTSGYALTPNLCKK